MSDKVIVSKGLIDNIAKPLIQATESTDNLSLTEMATAAQMMLPEKWELTVDTTVQEEVNKIEYEIKNAVEVHIEITNDDFIQVSHSSSDGFLRSILWGVNNIYVEKLTSAHVLVVIHAQKVNEDVIVNCSYVGTEKSQKAIRYGAMQAFQAVDDTIGIYFDVDTLAFNPGTRIRIWAKRRVAANE